MTNLQDNDKVLSHSCWDETKHEEQKHFKYEGNAVLKVNKPKEIEVQDVIFLTPARVKTKEDGQDFEHNVSVDFVNRKVYDQHGLCSGFSEQIFEYLDKTNALPEDLFEAPPEVYDKANEAYREKDNLRSEYGS